MLAPITVVPSLAVVAAATAVFAAWAAVGLVNPGMVNVIVWPEVKVPAVNETIKTKGPAPLSAAVPAPPAPAVKVRVPAPVSARPAPVSVIKSLPLLGTVVTGVSLTLMVTDVAPLATLLSVMAGCELPRDVPSRMAEYVPVMLAPTTVVPSLPVVAAATSVFAG